MKFREWKDNTIRNHPKHKRPKRFYWFRTGALAILLEQDWELIMKQQLHVDQQDTLGIQATDVAGTNVPFVPDAVPVWTNSNPAAATLTVAADGLLAVLVPIGAVGDATSVSVSASIGKSPFTATNDYNLVAGAVAAIAITDTFSPKP
jgi:hypothetical protein